MTRATSVPAPTSATLPAPATATHAAPTTATHAALHRLAAVLAQENAALAALDLGAVGALLAEKEAALAALAAHAPPAPPPAELASPARAVATLAQDNRRLLDRAIAVQGQVIALVARAGTRGPAVSYAATGRRAMACTAPPRTLCARA